MQDKIWLSSPHMGEEEQKFVQKAFDTNWIAPLGPNVNGFEEDLQQRLRYSKSTFSKYRFYFVILERHTIL